MANLSVWFDAVNQWYSNDIAGLIDTVFDTVNKTSTIEQTRCDYCSEMPTTSSQLCIFRTAEMMSGRRDQEEETTKCTPCPSWNCLRTRTLSISIDDNSHEDPAAVQQVTGQTVAPTNSKKCPMESSEDTNVSDDELEETEKKSDSSSSELKTDGPESVVDLCRRDTSLDSSQEQKQKETSTKRVLVKQDHVPSSGSEKGSSAGSRNNNPSVRTQPPINESKDTVDDEDDIQDCGDGSSLGTPQERKKEPCKVLKRQDDHVKGSGSEKGSSAGSNKHVTSPPPEPTTSLASDNNSEDDKDETSLLRDAKSLSVVLQSGDEHYASTPHHADLYCSSINYEPEKKEDSSNWLDVFRDEIAENDPYGFTF